jgi:hypothetical protein
MATNSAHTSSGSSAMPRTARTGAAEAVSAAQGTACTTMIGTLR